MSRPLWKQVALPAEHGGWGLTLEPVLLGLLVAPSFGGGAIGVAALAAFLVRTPLKLAVIDRRRHQWASRSRLAAAYAAGELVLIAAAAAFALTAAGPRWLLPIAVAVPFVAVELAFDVRSRGRRLVPELCGSVGMASVAAAIVVAAGEAGGLAVALWLVLAARAIAAIPFVRAQIMRLRRGSGPTRSADVAQLIALAVGAAAVVLEWRALVGAVALVLIAVLHALWLRRPPTPAKVLGLRQMALGFSLVLATAVGTWIL